MKQQNVTDIISLIPFMIIIEDVIIITCYTGKYEVNFQNKRINK